MQKKNQRQAPAPIPVSILTGFLGAGKTTLLNQLLADPELAGTLVLINEFGEIGLDHLFVEAIDKNMMLLASGCLCCTIRGELVDTLEDILRRRDNGRMADFNRILIETTGLADPAPVMQTYMQHPYLSLRFYPESLITTVDAINGLSTLSNHTEAVRQVAMADRIVLTKSDLLQADERSQSLEHLRNSIFELNRSAVLIDKQSSPVNAAELFDGSLYNPESKSADVKLWLGDDTIDAHHSPDHVHAHDPNQHNARIKACCLRSEEPLDPAQFELFIEMLRKVHGAHLLRVKGLVALTDAPERPLVIHGVQHIFHPPVRLDAWPSDDRTTRLVCILQDLEPSFVAGLWDAFNGGIDIDRPDVTGLTDNPLNPRGGGLLG